MTILSFIIATIVISFCTSMLIGCYLYKVFEDKYDEKVGRLDSKVSMLEERFFYLEDNYKGHIGKYH